MKKNLFLGLLVVSFIALVSVTFYFFNNFSKLVDGEGPYLKVALAANRTSLTFQWQKNDDDTAYYKLYHGVRPLVYGEFVKTSSNVSSLVLDISKFNTYDHYFALSAVDAYGNESEKSTEIYINLDPNVLSCGNGLLDEGEICDGNYKLCEIDGYVGQKPCSFDCLGWEAGCQAVGNCGDGIINGPEACEGSGIINCSLNGYLGETQCNPLTCQFTGACDIGNQFCGNGIKEGWEECDGLSMSCTIGGFPGEKGCVDCLLSDECVKIPVCGDEYLDPFEECEGFGQTCTLGLYTGYSDCVNCQYLPCDIGNQVCGNNTKEGNELCDGNTESCYTDIGGYLGERECSPDCSSFGECVSDLRCGDGIVNGNEVCDKNGPAQPCNDPNNYIGGEQFCKDDCSGYDTCSAGLSCNDGILSNPPELCEIGDSQNCQINGYNGNQLCATNCLAWQTCQTTESCGDGIKNGNEACDRNDPNSARPCNNTPNGYPGGEETCLFNCKGWGNCETDLRCGDGIITSPIEKCDIANPDETCHTLVGNYLGTKACQADCSDWEDCVSDLKCGDGVKNGNEVCDSDTVSCPLSNGYPMEKTCNNDCSGYGNCEATQWCGDGDVNGPELCEIGQIQACSDINNYNGEQICNADCLGWGECIITESCSDGIVNGNEACDINSFNDCIADNGENGKMPCLPDCSGYSSDMCCPEKFIYDGGPWDEALTVRDGSGYYRGVLIGDQCWMQDNLNAGVVGSPVMNDNIVQKYCYNNKPANCRHYGGLYIWREAMMYSNIEGSRGACPEGWHVPTDLEFNELEKYTVDYINSPNEQSLCGLHYVNNRCGDLNSNLGGLKGAGISLRDESVGGDNLLNFNLLLSGEYKFGSFRYLGQKTNLLVSSPFTYSKYRHFSNNDWTNNNFIGRSHYSGSYFISLRCIMDE